MKILVTGSTGKVGSEVIKNSVKARRAGSCADAAESAVLDGLRHAHDVPGLS